MRLHLTVDDKGVANGVASLDADGFVDELLTIIRSEF
jgi:hypothetical protein